MKIPFLPIFRLHFLFGAQRVKSFSFLFIVCSLVCAVDRGVPDGEHEEEFDREPEPEDQYREQELPEGFENVKSNLIL
uniref:Uncharacterized protein n=1 Tax=Setaria viridis TaxID=4556 RepID=A0A4U6SXK3_SETVI|nr:hypothetical protein SEVIR_9G203050v2 [Setaria viridis]